MADALRAASASRAEAAALGVVNPPWSDMIRHWSPDMPLVPGCARPRRASPPYCEVFVEPPKGRTKRCGNQPVYWCFFACDEETRRIVAPRCPSTLQIACGCEAHFPRAYRLPAPASHGEAAELLDHLWTKPWFTGEPERSLPPAMREHSDNRFGLFWDWSSPALQRLAYSDYRRSVMSDPRRLPVEAGAPRVSVYISGRDVSVVTDAADETEYLPAFVDAYERLDGGVSREARVKAVRAAFDILSKLRGYKADVLERRMIAAGRWPHPTEAPAAESGEPGTEGT